MRKELGISHLAELTSTCSTIFKKAVEGKTVSFEELNQLMDTPRAHYTAMYKH